MKEISSPRKSSEGEVSKPARNITAILSILMYMGCSITMILANKAISTSVPEDLRSKIPKFGVVFFQVKDSYLYIASNVTYLHAL